LEIMTQGRIRRAAVVAAAPAVDDLAVLLPDWRTHLRSRNVASSTIASYLKVGDDLLRWLQQAGMPTSAAGIAREHLEAFLAALSDRLSPATVAKHYRSLQQLFRWLVEDGEVGHSPMDRMRPPAVPEQPVDILTDDQLRALLDAARGNTFENRRDTAMLRMLIDTGMRAGELTGLAVTDLDSEQSVAIVMGKARRGRAVPYGAKTADALRRYLRARSSTPWPPRSRCGWVRRGASPTPVSGRCSNAVLPMPGCRTSTRTGSGTPTPTPGSPPVARNRT
jgi:site-specific recombinase XerD